MILAGEYGRATVPAKACLLTSIRNQKLRREAEESLKGSGKMEKRGALAPSHSTKSPSER